MECPDPLAWSPDIQACTITCIQPYYTDAQFQSVFIIESTLACIGFLLCYFYCFTAILRPVMLYKQGVIVFWMHFCMVIFSITYFLPLFLGERYVLCDSATDPATQDNAACSIMGFLFMYSTLSFFVWIALFHVHMAMRLYLIRIPKHIMWFYFFLAFGTWSALTIIVGFSLKLMAAPTGAGKCLFLLNDANFMWGMVVSIFYVVNAILFFAVLLIIIRLLQLRKVTDTPWKQMVAKHFRLVTMWAYHLLFIIYFTLVMAYADRAFSKRDVFEEKIIEYVFCIFGQGADQCELGEVPIIPFGGVMLPSRIIQAFYPILLFLVFGARWSLLNFWKEYFMATWKNKRLYLQFTPSFDPSLTLSESRHTRENTEEESRSSGSSSLKKIKRAIKDL